MQKKISEYTDNGNLEIAELQVVTDNLPSPEEFAQMQKKRKVTIAFKPTTIAYFKELAAKHAVSYQNLISDLLDRVANEGERIDHANS